MMLIDRHRRFLCAVAIASCGVIVTLLAAERATVILDDGERISGTVVTRGGRGSRSRESAASPGDLTLLTDDGREVGIPLDRMAVLQFGDGQPAPAELGALPRDNTQMMVRRNGTRETGQFVGVAGDDVVRWQARNGREQMIPFRELTRIYLHADRARTAFDEPVRSRPDFTDDRRARAGNRDDANARNGTEQGFGNRNRNGNGNGNGNNANGGTGGRPGAGQNVGDVRVDANQAWTSTGLNVRASDLVVFRASGQINFGQGATQTAGPEGNDSQKRAEYPVSGSPVGGLIGRVGNGAPFAIGGNTQPISMPASGMLMLGVNDNELNDNSGAFTVAITRQ